MLRRHFLKIVAGLTSTPILSACSVSAKPKNPYLPRALEIKTRRISAFLPSEPERTRFQALEFLGGLELKSEDADFGGLSSLVMDANGVDFLALSDRAHWVSGRFVLEGERLIGVEQARITPMMMPEGRLMRRSRAFDSEGLARKNNLLYVSVERIHAVFAFDAQNLSAPARVIAVPSEFKSLDYNSGIEAIDFFPASSAWAGSFMAIAEKTPAHQISNKNMPAFIINGDNYFKLEVKESDAYQVTDMRFLENGDLLILERAFAPFLKIGMRIRRIKARDIKADAVLEGEILIEADMAYFIDNMEGLAVHRDKSGRLILTLLSDDNFSRWQRSLVLRFALVET